MAVKLGRNCKIYRNTGTYGTPTWNEVPNVSDVSLSTPSDEADASTRASKVKKVVKTMLGIEVSLKQLVDDGDADYTAFQAAITSDTPLDLLILDGDKATDGTTGFRADWAVFGGAMDQGLGAALYQEYTLKPAYSANEPKSVSVAGAALAYASIT